MVTLDAELNARSKQNDDLELVAVFTRRDPASVKIQTEGSRSKAL